MSSRSSLPFLPFLPFRLVLGIAVISVVSLAYEMALTRIIALHFQYHYVFLLLSLAVLGISLGAAGGQAMWVSTQAAAQAVLLRNSLLALSLALPMVAIALALLPSSLIVIGAFFLAPIPFVLIGFATTRIFAQARASSGTLYAADLIGAAVGIVAALALLNITNPFTLIILLGCLVVPIALLVEPAPRAHSNRRRIGALAISIGVIGLLNAATNVVDYKPSRIDSAPPDKTLISVLHDPDLQARVVESIWNPFARIDVVETNDPTQKLVFTDGGAGSYMLRFDGNLNTLVSNKVSIEYAPFALRPGQPKKVLILGAGAGKDIVLALLGGNTDITAVEVNPAMVATTRKYGQYNGQIFDRPEVKLHLGDARNFVDSSHDQYDLVYLNVVYAQAAPPAAQALLENYIFTAEAFGAYLQRLAPGGKLVLILHNGLEGTRAAITAIKALQGMGIEPAKSIDHIALLMRNNDDPTQRVSMLLVGTAPLTENEIGGLQSLSTQLDLQPLHLPTVFDLGFKNLKQGMSLERFVAIDTSYDLFPTSDNQPFFYKLDPGVPAPVITALGFAIALGVAIVLYAFGQPRAEVSPPLLGFVALLGMGFMLIEISLIQRLSITIGAPTISIALILGSLLVSSGIGSWISQHWPVEQLPCYARWAGLASAALGLAYLLMFPSLTPTLAQISYAPRLVLIALLVALIGLPMGVPFASALRLAGGTTQNIGLLWAINGAFSVVGSTVAMALAMSAGFQSVFMAGIACYILLIPLLAYAERLITSSSSIS